MRPGALCLCLAACAPTGGNPGAGVAEDTAAMVYSTEPPEPLLTNDEIALALEALVALGAPNGHDIAETWLERLSHGDELCPGHPAVIEVPPGGCRTAEGWYFSGIGWYELSDSETGAGGETVELSYYNGGDFEIIPPDGLRFAGGGELRATTTDEEGTRTTAFELLGSWIDEGRSDWLGAGFSAVYTGTITGSPHGNALTLTGGLSVGDTDLYMDGLALDEAGACAGALMGTIAVRDARGYWSTLDLGDDCDACGAVTFHEDQDQGELCLDLSSWGQELIRMNAPR